MKKHKYKIICSLIVVIVVIALATLRFCYSEKPVHLSFDDVSICMSDLTKDSLKYNSIFEQPFLADLKQLHESTGAKFTLYVYEMDKDYDIAQFPDKFASEFDANHDWLCIGYHAKRPEYTPDSIAQNDAFCKSFTRVDSILAHKFKRAKSNTLRLHYFYATPEKIKLVISRGITKLLAADDDRISYSLPENDNAQLQSQELLQKDGMTYVSTDLRIERDNTLWGLIKNANDDEFVIFTHEWAYNGLNRGAYKVIIHFLNMCNCKYENK